MSPQISSEIMPVWRVTDGEDLPYLGEYERYVHGKELHHSTLFFEHFFPDHAHNYTCKIGELEATVLLDMESKLTRTHTHTHTGMQVYNTGYQLILQVYHHHRRHERNQHCNSLHHSRR